MVTSSNIYQKVRNNKKMEDLTYEELKEIALSLNLMSAKRNDFKLDKTIDKYKEDNNKFLEMDRVLLGKVKNDMAKLKELEEC